MEGDILIVEDTMKLYYQSAKNQVIEVRENDPMYGMSTTSYPYYSLTTTARHNIVYIMQSQFTGLRHNLSIIFNEDDQPAQFFWGIGGI